MFIKEIGDHQWSVEVEPNELGLTATTTWPHRSLVGFINKRGTLRVSHPVHAPRIWGRVAKLKLEDARRQLVRTGALVLAAHVREQRKEEREGQNIVRLSNGKTRRFHGMRSEETYRGHVLGAHDWADQELSKMPPGSTALFFKASGKWSTEPFHALQKDEYGRIRVASLRDLAQGSPRRRSRKGIMGFFGRLFGHSPSSSWETGAHSHAANNLILYADNTSELYAAKKAAIERAKTFVVKGRYTAEGGTRLWLYWINEAAKRYKREFGSDAEPISPAARRDAAQVVAARVHRAILNGEYGSVGGGHSPGRGPVPGMWYVEHKVHGRVKDRFGPFRTQNEAFVFRDKVERNRGIHPIPGDIITLPLYKAHSPGWHKTPRLHAKAAKLGHRRHMRRYSHSPRPYREITKSDVGKALFAAFGRTWSVSGFIGRILPMDVGKRVVLVAPDMVQVENNEQRDRRLGGQRSPSGATDRYTVFTRSKTNPRGVRLVERGLTFDDARAVCASGNDPRKKVWYEFTTDRNFIESWGRRR